MMLNVIYEDAAVLVVEKPAGVEAQASRGVGRDMVSEIKKYLVKHGAKPDPYVGVVHRLDQPVRGIMVYGKTKEAAAALSRQMAEQGHMEKGYLALVCGKPQQKTGRLVDNLYFDRRTNTSCVVENPHTVSPEVQHGCKRAELTYELVKDVSGDEIQEILAQDTADALKWLYFQKELKRLLQAGMFNREKQYALLHIRLLTGRHHQIRVQLSHAGIPILGDMKYNPAMEHYRGLASLCLCAWEIGFVHPVTGKHMLFQLKIIEKNVTKL